MLCCNMLLLFLAANFCIQAEARSRITDDTWKTRRCANLNPYVDENTIILIAERNSKWNTDQFCHAFRKNMKVSGSYKMSVDFQLGGPTSDYPGFIFNKWDDCNYDWLYKQLSISELYFMIEQYILW